MNNVYELSKHIDPVEEASDWLAKCERGLTIQEEDALQEWLGSDPKNAATLLEVARIWDRMDSLSRLAAIFPLPQTANQQSSLSRLVLPIAAIVLLIVLGGLWSIFAPHLLYPPQVLINAGNEQVFQTAVGEQSTVNLPDGSQLTLNTNSMISVTFTNEQRLLTLKRGEVYIQVAHDESRPLNVYIGNKVVKAIGTAFNLEITDNQRIELIVTEGKVLVGAINKETVIPGKTERTTSVPDSVLAVSAGEHIFLGDANEEVEQVETKEIEVKLSWRGGKLVFRGESLEDALTEIQRYTPVEFVILDEDLKKVRIVGLFKAGDVEGLLETLRENFDISYERVNDEKIILSYK